MKLVALIIALLIASLCLRSSTPAAAQELLCIPAAAVLEQGAFPALPKGSIGNVIRFNPAETAEAIKWFNAQPPPGDHGFDYVVMVERKDGLFLLFVGKDEQFCGAVAMNQQTLTSFVNAVMGIRT